MDGQSVCDGKLGSGWKGVREGLGSEQGFAGREDRGGRGKCEREEMEGQQGYRTIDKELKVEQD